MFQIPSRADIDQVTINEQTVREELPPVLRRKRSDQDAA
jgi:ATP-dependent protease Clp ATPase subunit